MASILSLWFTFHLPTRGIFTLVHYFHTRSACFGKSSKRKLTEGMISHVAVLSHVTI